MWIIAIIFLFVVMGCGVLAAVCIGYTTGHLVLAIVGVVIFVLAAGVVWSFLSKESC